ncbi:hypothetical protein F511_38520 [Dorcoceras hygrometricum]|uniref:DNA-directed RNA polymerase V subunit 1 n=1 Tax=Dorcoceras hygrometricum TaxID=472368 RepID=A0A2Z7CFU2_9LAMI|nr:hypothetical protein F511_38520 [Dorcoceras hygrometricum]
MSLFDLQDVRIAIGSLATLDLPMVVDLIGIYGLKGPYCTLTTNNWFLQELSVIPRGSWGDVSRRSYRDPMGKSGIVIPEPQWFPPTGLPPGPAGPSQTSHGPIHGRTRENDPREENACSRPSGAPLATSTQDLAQPGSSSSQFLT